MDITRFAMKLFKYSPQTLSLMDPPYLQSGKQHMGMGTGIKCDIASLHAAASLLTNVSLW